VSIKCGLSRHPVRRAYHRQQPENRCGPSGSTTVAAARRCAPTSSSSSCGLCCRGRTRLGVVPGAARATLVTVEGVRDGVPTSRTLSVTCFRTFALRDGDAITLRGDGRPGTTLVRLEGEFNGPSLLAVRQERARLIQPLGRVVTARDNQQRNVVLESDDVLAIPARTNAVRVGGEVMVTQAVMSQPRAVASDYIRDFGGYTDRSDRSRVIIIHANAEVSVGDTDLPVYPGDELGAPQGGYEGATERRGRHAGHLPNWGIGSGGGGDYMSEQAAKVEFGVNIPARFASARCFASAEDKMRELERAAVSRTNVPLPRLAIKLRSLVRSGVEWWHGRELDRV
jgi:hypothetical protein